MEEYGVGPQGGAFPYKTVPFLKDTHEKHNKKNSQATPQMQNVMLFLIINKYPGKPL